MAQLGLLVIFPESGHPHTQTLVFLAADDFLRMNSLSSSGLGQAASGSPTDLSKNLELALLLLQLHLQRRQRAANMQAALAPAPFCRGPWARCVPAMQSPSLGAARLSSGAAVRGVFS